MIPFPAMPGQPSASEYFWHQLPWAVPGLFTFVVGMSLAGIAIAALRRTADRPLLVSFILFCVGFGSLGLVLASRAVVLDLQLLLTLNRIGYAAVVWLSPGAYFFTYFMTMRRYRILLGWGFVAMGTVALALFGLVIHWDFTEAWFHYPFGSFPIAALPLKIWGLVATAGYVAGGIPITIHSYRHHREELLQKKYLFIGLHLCSILVISNLPSLSGIPVFPMSAFALAPLLIIGYGIFRSDFLNINDLLFRQRGLFKFLGGLLTFGFVGIAILAAVTLKPAEHPGIYEKPIFLLPMLSGVAAFALAIFLAGSNPDQKLNMLAAASLMLAGAFMIVMTTFKLDLPLIVTRRIEQIVYTAFLFTPGVHLRFALMALGRTPPRIVRLVDAISAALCVVLWTPYFFSGFYEYWFGRISVGGPGLNAYGAVAFMTAAAFIATWWRNRKASAQGMGGLVILSLVIGDVLMFLNLPGTMGIPLYPLGDLQFIPAFLLAFAVARYGAIPLTGEATAIGNRMSVMILVFVPLSLTFYIIGLTETTGLSSALLHALLVGSPLALAFYMVSFIFLRPTAARMDETVRRLAEETERVNAALAATETARLEIEKQKEDTESLNRLIKSLNEQVDLQVIMEKVHAYMQEHFGIYYYSLLVTNAEKTHMHVVAGTLPDHVTPEEKQRIFDFTVPVKGAKGGHGLTLRRKRYVYFPVVEEKDLKWLTDDERMVVKVCNIRSYFFLPLLINQEPVGILNFSNSDKPMNLSEEDLTRLSILAEQLAGIISGSALFDQVQIARKNAELERRKFQKQKEDTESLNRLIKSLNEQVDLQVIMEKVHAYMQEHFGIYYYSLLVTNAEKTHMHVVAGTLPDHVTPEEKQRIFDFTVPVKGAKGGHGLTLRRKRYVYFPVIEEKDLKWLTDDERMVVKVCNIRSYFFLPLLINQEPVGILNFSNSDKPMNLSEEDLTRLSILAEQLAGIISGSALFDQVQIARNHAEIERRKSEKLLLNILPGDVAAELKEKGATDPVLYENVSVMFTDFKGFTQIAETMTPQELIQDLDACFVQFDKITERFNLEKLKTIGDSYMCAGGIPKRNKTHAVDCVLAALEIQSFMNLMKQIKEQQGLPYWELRLGIHTGPLVAGVIGEKKFAYDVWGDTVNTASRMESSGTPGRINISASTYELVKHLFNCEYRGEVNAKNKGPVGMYYVNGLKAEFALVGDPKAPNGKFWAAHADMQ